MPETVPPGGGRRDQEGQEYGGAALTHDSLGKIIASGIIRTRDKGGRMATTEKRVEIFGKDT